jgi:Lipocalin-like domain
MKIRNLILAVVVLTIASCKKDETQQQAPIPTTKDLIAKNWRQTSSVATYSYQPGSFDDFATWPPCDKDNISKYNINGTYTYTGGASKCNPSEQEVLDSGSWSLSNNDTKFSFTTSGTTYTFDIVEITNSSFKIKQTEVFSYGTIYTTSTFVAAP